RLRVFLKTDAEGNPFDTPVLRGWPRPARAHLTVFRFDLSVNDHPQQALDLLLREDAPTDLPRLAQRAERPPAGRLQPFLAGMGSLQTLLPTLPVLFLFWGAAIPQHPVAFRTASRSFHAVVDDIRPIPASRVRLAMHLRPGHGVRLQV